MREFGDQGWRAREFGDQGWRSREFGDKGSDKERMETCRAEQECRVEITGLQCFFLEGTLTKNMSH